MTGKLDMEIWREVARTYKGTSACSAILGLMAMVEDGHGALKAILDDFDNSYDGEPLSIEKHAGIERARKVVARLERAS